MADSAIENARSLQADLEARIRKLQHDINLLRAQKENVDQFIAQWKRFAGQDYSADVAVSNSSVQVMVRKTGRPIKSLIRRIPHAPPTPTTSSNINSKKEDVARAARRLIHIRGEPIPRDLLYRLLITEGLVIEGTDAEKAMNTMLWRTRGDPELAVIHLRGVGYWLRERPWEPAGYDPSYDELIGAEDGPPEGADDLEP